MSRPTRARPVGESRAAMRNIIVTALSMPTITAADLRVVLAVLELTAAHGKLLDRTLRSQIAERAGVSERTATRSLTKLDKLGVLEWKPARGPGMFGSLRLCVAPVEKPEGIPLTRDTWMSRVQPNARQDESQRETPENQTRDIGDVPLPPFHRPSPPNRKFSPMCEHGWVYDANDVSTCPHHCRRDREEERSFKDPNLTASITDLAAHLNRESA